MNFNEDMNLIMRNKFKNSSFSTGTTLFYQLNRINNINIKNINNSLLNIEENDKINETDEEKDNNLLMSQDSLSSLTNSQSLLNFSEKLSPKITKKTQNKIINEIKQIEENGFIKCCLKLKCYEKFNIDEIKQLRYT